MTVPSVSASSSVPGLEPSFRTIGSRNIQVMRYGQATSGHARNRLPNTGGVFEVLGGEDREHGVPLGSSTQRPLPRKPASRNAGYRR